MKITEAVENLFFLLHYTRNPGRITDLTEMKLTQPKPRKNPFAVKTSPRRSTDSKRSIGQKAENFET